MYLVTMAIGLLLLLFTSSTTLGSSAKDPVFTNKPKPYTEAFVGKYVLFTWDYISKPGQVTKVKFGIKNGTRDIVLVFKNIADGLVYENSQEPETKDLSLRTDFIRSIKNRNMKATFNITKLRMNDSGTYFCALLLDDFRTKTEYVKLSIVDLIINQKISSQDVQSWDGNTVKLLCSVIVAKGSSVKFTWVRQPNNQTISRGQHIDTRVESLLTVETDSENSFNTYTCIAKTKHTTKIHNINIRRLYPPSKPRNLKQELVFDKKLANSFQRVYWDEPEEDGGANVLDYIIEYKPQGIDWNKATRRQTKKKEYVKFTLKEGKKYDVQVYARNKVGRGPPSNMVEIKVDNHMTSASANTDGSAASLQTSALLTMVAVTSSLLMAVKILN